ncbi:MAG: SDR family oxidoreductase [Polyangiaceae bacterium]|nr:SDR family oxidoreductase [Polyangiaceae bacterium]
MKKPTGNLAVITGASRGIGRAAAIAFARRGVRVALLGRSSPMLEDAAEAATEAGADARSFVCDVAREDDVARAAEDVITSMGTPRYVINNAGIVRRGARVEATSPVDWDDVIAVNLRGPFLVSRAFLPSMLAEKRGRLIHVASISATIGCDGAASYAASKWGLVGLAKSLAEELRDRGLQSIAVLPGSVDTEMLEGSGFSPQMSAEDVANLIVYTSMDAPDAVNGSAIEMFG